MGNIDDNRESLGVIRPLFVSSAVESKRFLCVLILSQIMCTISAGQYRIIGVKIRPRIKGHYAHPGKFINREQVVCPIIIDNITERVSFCHRTVIKISRCIMSRTVNALKRDFVCEIWDNRFSGGFHLFSDSNSKGSILFPPDCAICSFWQRIVIVIV